jgi:hypothetical protein
VEGYKLFSITFHDINGDKFNFHVFSISTCCILKVNAKLFLCTQKEVQGCRTITFHWVKGHVGLKESERADSLVKTVVRYNTAIAYNEIPINRGKQ